MVKRATASAVVVPRARLTVAACLSACARLASHKTAVAGRTDARRPARAPFASESVAALSVRTLLSRRWTRGS
eukprot:4452012-Prymnesium_polylepis.1